MRNSSFRASYLTFLARDNWQCVMCGKKEELQFNHIIPYSKGGSNTPENLQILCAPCNKKKYTNIIL